MPIEIRVRPLLSKKEHWVKPQVGSKIRHLVFGQITILPEDKVHVQLGRLNGYFSGKAITPTNLWDLKFGRYFRPHRIEYHLKDANPDGTKGP